MSCVNCMVTPCACRRQKPTVSLALLEELYPGWAEDAICESGRHNCHPISESYRDTRSDSDEDVGKPLLVLGGNEVDVACLQRLGVTHILSLVSQSGQPPAADGVDGFAREVIHIEDQYDADFWSALPIAHRFIDSAVESEGLCYVHCQMGRSRSAAMVISWLMLHRARQGLPPALLECVAAVASRRRITAMNYGFWARLSDFEISLGVETTTLPLVWLCVLHLRPSLGVFPYSPPPTYVEAIREARLLGEVASSPRIRSIRRCLQGLITVLAALDDSYTCHCALKELHVDLEEGSYVGRPRTIDVQTWPKLRG